MQFKCIISQVIVFLIIGLAKAPCGEMRPATERETAFYVRAMSTMEKALPPGPLDWKAEERSLIAPPALVAADAAWRPVVVQYAVTWVDARRKKIAGIGEKHSLRNLEKAQEERARAEAQQKRDKLTSEREKAYQNRDLAAAQELDQDIENIAAQIRKSKSWDEDEDKPEVEVQLGTTLQVTLDLNVFSVVLAHAASEEIVLPAAAQAWRLPDGFDGDGIWQEGTTIVFLGRDWQAAGTEPLVIRAAEPVGLPSTHAYTLVVSARGDSNRAREYLQAIDWLALEALLFK